MRKLGKRILFCAVLAVSLWTGSVLADRNILNQELIRLHVVADSDSPEDQAIKLQVRDAVIQCIQRDLEKLQDMEAARMYLQENLPRIRQVAKTAMAQLGCDADVAVTLCREAFDKRRYETFTLPAGVYESLRIVIGRGEGKNWWCVAFPGLCIPATAETFSDAAEAAGFPDALTGALSGDAPYEIRFFFLDVLGRLENIFLRES